MFINEKEELEKLRKISKLIIMLPFAGGNSYCYKEIIRFLPPGIAVICPELPGRGSLSEQSFITDVMYMADYIFEHWLRGCLNDNKRYVIYGHSMGALLGFLLVHKIKKASMKMPEELVVSGRGGPQFISEREALHDLPSIVFWERLAALGGMAADILSDGELLDYFEPILRADMKAIESHCYLPTEMIDIPIRVIYGLDEKLTEKAVACWQMETQRTIAISALEGEHFFIFDHPGTISKLISHTLLF